MAVTYKNGQRGNDILSLQKDLKTKGYDPGPLDGIYGPRTNAAYQRYLSSQSKTEPNPAPAATPPDGTTRVIKEGFKNPVVVNGKVMESSQAPKPDAGTVTFGGTDKPVGVVQGDGSVNPYFKPLTPQEQATNYANQLGGIQYPDLPTAPDKVNPMSQEDAVKQAQEQYRGIYNNLRFQSAQGLMERANQMGLLQQGSTQPLFANMRSDQALNDEQTSKTMTLARDILNGERNYALQQNDQNWGQYRDTVADTKDELNFDYGKAKDLYDIYNQQAQYQEEVDRWNKQFNYQSEQDALANAWQQAEALGYVTPALAKITGLKENTPMLEAKQFQQQLEAAAAERDAAALQAAGYVKIDGKLVPTADSAYKQAQTYIDQAKLANSTTTKINNDYEKVQKAYDTGVTSGRNKAYSYFDGLPSATKRDDNGKLIQFGVDANGKAWLKNKFDQYYKNLLEKADPMATFQQGKDQILKEYPNTGAYMINALQNALSQVPKK